MLYVTLMGFTFGIPRMLMERDPAKSSVQKALVNFPRAHGGRRGGGEGRVRARAPRSTLHNMTSAALGGKLMYLIARELCMYGSGMDRCCCYSRVQSLSGI